MVFGVKQFHRQGRALVLHTFELSGNLVVTLAMYTSNACRFTKEFGSHGIELPELSPVDAWPIIITTIKLNAAVLKQLYTCFYTALVN